MRIARIFLMLVISRIVSPAAFGVERPSEQPSAANKQRHVVVMVWDGMRPDFVTEQNAPTLYQLARHGVTFAHHHSVYLSATEVNGTSLSTGVYPAHDGIMGNNEYRPQLNDLKAVHTESPEAVLKGDRLTQGHYVRLPTVAEIVRQAGGRAVVAGAKAVALLADRSLRSSEAGGVNLFAGSTLPASLLQAITNRYGEFPSDKATSPTRCDWTTDALIDPLWANGVPEFTFLWMNQPDARQHQTGPGSPESLEAIRNADDNLTKVLTALEANGARDTTDIMVVSDHGCSTVSASVDLAAALHDTGILATREFKTKPSRGAVIVVSNSGSSLIYVIGHDAKVIAQVVRFLQGWEFSGVIFTRKAMPGTFSLSQVHVDSEDAPDVIVSLRWTGGKNKRGVPGMLASDLSGFVPGQGAHVSLSPFDMHATLIAAGPDFRSGFVDELPTGNVDVAPTVLRLLGIKPPKPMDGRVLTEALAAEGNGYQTR